MTCGGRYAGPALLLGLLSLAPVLAEQQAPQGKVLDLVFRVEDTGGKVEDLRVRESGTEVVIDLAADVLFEFDKADVRLAAAETLKEAAAVIREKSGEKGSVRVEGHTDGKGSASYNQTLSERRAESVRKWLIETALLGQARISTSGFGAKKPVAPNQKPDGTDDPEGRQKNRRVEIIVQKRR
ncbi:MAG: OmpA family protein [Acidobacteria bacterium]|nr:OmpA family protein [Acidobacteriota bacterium]MCA1611924.1 OmpA family protein [Acidobacteriota bacterium]